MNHIWVYWTLVLVQILFGINFVSSKYLVHLIDPNVWAFIRFFISGIFLMSFCLIFRRKQRPDLSLKRWPRIIWMSLIGMTLPQLAIMNGLHFTSANNTAILCASIPLVTLGLTISKRLEKFHLLKFLGLMFGLFGVVFIRDLSSIHFSQSTAKGDLLVLTNCIFMAIFFSTSSAFFRSMDQFWSTAILFCVSSIMMFISLSLQGKTIHIPQSNTILFANMIFSIFYWSTFWSYNNIPTIIQTN